MGRLSIDMAMGTINNITNGFDNPPVKKIKRASWMISAPITKVVVVSLSLLFQEYNKNKIKLDKANAPMVK